MSTGMDVRRDAVGGGMEEEARRGAAGVHAADQDPVVPVLRARDADLLELLAPVGEGDGEEDALAVREGVGEGELALTRAVTVPRPRTARKSPAADLPRPVHHGDHVLTVPRRNRTGAEEDEAAPWKDVVVHRVQPGRDEERADVRQRIPARDRE